MDNLSRGTYHVGIIAGYLCVAALLVMAAAWRRHVEQRFTDSTAARVVANGLIASAGALSLGYGWKGAMAVYLPGGMDHGAYPTDGLYVLYMLNDFGAYIGWLGTMVAAGAIAYMAFREKTVSRWIGVVSCLLLLPVMVFVVATGLPGSPASSAGCGCWSRAWDWRSARAPGRADRRPDGDQVRLGPNRRLGHLQRVIGRVGVCPGQTPVLQYAV